VWVQQAAADPVVPGVLYVASSQGFSVTTDGGATWTTTQPFSAPVSSLTVDAGHPGTLYATVLHYGPVWKSTDRGATWYRVYGGLTSRDHVGSVVVDPQAADTAYLSSGNGVLKSTSAGE
jgi:hypothetical protein